jgi:hypothetical protein
MRPKNREQDAKHPDRMGRMIVRASARNEEEAEAVISSPFLYARLRARIESERARRAEREGWPALLGVVWRAVPAMAVVTLLAFVLFLSATLMRTGTGDGDEALFGESGEVERVVFAGGDRRQLSRDDVLATILDEDERGGGAR